VDKVTKLPIIEGTALRPNEKTDSFLQLFMIPWGENRGIKQVAVGYTKYRDVRRAALRSWEVLENPIIALRLCGVSQVALQDHRKIICSFQPD